MRIPQGSDSGFLRKVLHKYPDLKKKSETKSENSNSQPGPAVTPATNTTSTLASEMGAVTSSSDGVRGETETETDKRRSAGSAGSGVRRRSFLGLGGSLSSSLRSLTKKAMSSAAFTDTAFSIVHYAADVCYDVSGFLVNAPIFELKFKFKLKLKLKLERIYFHLIRKLQVAYTLT